MWITDHYQSKCLGLYFLPAWISSNPFLQPERVTLLQNLSLPCTGRVAVSPPEHAVIYSLPRSHRLHSPLCRDCRQRSCQHTRCHGIALRKHPAFTLYIFPPVQAETAHKHTEGLIYTYDKSPFFIPCSEEKPWCKRSLLGGWCNSSTENQTHMAFNRHSHMRAPTHACKHGKSPTRMHIPIYSPICILVHTAL